MSVNNLRNQLRRLVDGDADGNRCPRCRSPFDVGELERIRDAVLDGMIAGIAATSADHRHDDPFAAAYRAEGVAALDGDGCPHCGEPLAELLDFALDPIVSALQRAERGRNPCGRIP